MEGGSRATQFKNLGQLTTWGRFKLTRVRELKGPADKSFLFPEWLDLRFSVVPHYLPRGLSYTTVSYIFL